MISSASVVRAGGIALALALGAIAVGAQATPITLDLRGHIDLIFPTAGPFPATGAISIGDPIDLRVTYDPAAFSLVNFIDPPGTAVYYGGALTYALTLPAYARSGQVTPALYVGDNSAFGGSSQIFDQLGWNLDDIDADQTNPPFDLGGDPYIEYVNFTLEDDTATALSSFALPMDIPISGFRNRQSINLGFFSLSTQRGLIAQADITVTQSAGVPEPGSWALLLVGLGLAGVFIRGRSRTAGVRLA